MAGINFGIDMNAKPLSSKTSSRDLQLEVMGLRDALTGANARAATAEWRLALAENRIKSMQKAVKHRNQMLNSLTWKVGTAVLLPLRPVRYALSRLRSEASK